MLRPIQQVGPMNAPLPAWRAVASVPHPGEAAPRVPPASSLQLPASSGQGHRRRFPRTKYSQHPPGGRPGSPRQWHLGRQPSHSSTRTTGICPGTGQGDPSFYFSISIIRKYFLTRDAYFNKAPPYVVCMASK